MDQCPLCGGLKTQLGYDSIRYPDGFQRCQDCDLPVRHWPGIANLQATILDLQAKVKEFQLYYVPRLH